MSNTYQKLKDIEVGSLVRLLDGTEGRFDGLPLESMPPQGIVTILENGDVVEVDGDTLAEVVKPLPKPVSRPSSRRAILRIPHEYLASILQLPENFQIDGWFHDFERDSIALRVLSPDFPEVPEGEYSPDVNLVYMQGRFEDQTWQRSEFRGLQDQFRYRNLIEFKPEEK